MLLIRTKSGAEIRVPAGDVSSVVDVELQLDAAKPVPPHPYLHREGGNRCAACRHDRLHRSHTDTAIH